MIFNWNEKNFESEKERNLYYKVFAGYLFNEMIPGHEDRLDSFVTRILKKDLKLNSETTHVSFDNYAYHIDSAASDRGEFADISIYDHQSKTLVAIEAKFRTDWSFEKDIVENNERLKLIAEKLEVENFVQCLLVTKDKLEASEGMLNHPGSNMKKLRESDFDITIFTWEQLLEVIPEISVRDYLSRQLREAGANGKT